ncbi:MAG: DNA internalization-related competence protein ComEC/Rec2 [Candidatus Izemoplasmatales bacterium]
MRRSRTTFASESGNYVHLGIAAVLALLSIRHAVSLPFLFAEFLHLWKRARRMFVGALFVSAFLVVRAAMDAQLPEAIPTSFSGVVLSVEEDRYVVRTDAGRLLVFHDGSVVVRPGDEVVVATRSSGFEPRSVEHGFDYGTYLLGRGIAGTCRARSTTVTGHRFVLGAIPYFLSADADRRFDGDARVMVGLFVLGDADALSPELQETGRDLGVSHLFAVSGMHVGAIALFLERLLARLHASRTATAVAIGVSLFFFAAVTGFSVSVVRAAATYLALAVAKLTRFPLPPADAIALTAVGALSVHPFALYDVGFQLSYLVAFAIILGGGLVVASDPVRRTLSVTILAQAVAMPILLELNGALSPVSIPANLVFVLFVDRLAVPLSFFCWFVPAAEGVLDLAGRGFFLALEAVGRVDLAIPFNLSSDLAKAFYWIGVGLILVRLSRKRRIGLSPLVALLGAALLSLSPRLPGTTVVKVLDVGQGDATYIAASGCRMLVDTGAPDAYDTVLEYLLKENVRRLDVLVLTHGDSDHDGETRDLDAVLEIGAIVSGTELCPDCRADERIVAAGEILACGTLRFEVLNAGSDDNDGSVVLDGMIGSDRWLFMGDAGTNVERRIVWPDVDVLKVGHHGSDTSTTQEFLDSTTPSVAVISVGRTNGYGHPHAEVLSRLTAAGAAILRTDRLGTITFTYLPGGIRILGSRSEDDRFAQAAGKLVRVASVFLSDRRRGIIGPVIG